MKEFLLSLVAVAAIILATNSCKKSAEPNGLIPGKQKNIAAIPMDANHKPLQIIQPNSRLTPGSLDNLSRNGIIPLAGENNFSAIDSVSDYYLTETSMIDFSGFGDCTEHDSVSDGNLTVTFSSPMQKYWVLGGPEVNCWYNGQWGFYPDVEDPNPHVLFSAGQNSMILQLSHLVNVFGFELSPNAYGTFNYRVSFYNNLLPIGSVNREVFSAEDDLASARLFAAKSKFPFDKILIELLDDDSMGFVIGEVRHARWQGIVYKWSTGDFNRYWHLNSPS